jgi:hypothetical protein
MVKMLCIIEGLERARIQFLVSWWLRDTDIKLYCGWMCVLRYVDSWRRLEILHGLVLEPFNIMKPERYDGNRSNIRHVRLWTDGNIKGAERWVYESETIPQIQI